MGLTTSCCFASHAIIESMPPDVRREGKRMVFILALLVIFLLIEVVIAVSVAIAIITDIFSHL